MARFDSRRRLLFALTRRLGSRIRFFIRNRLIVVVQNYHIRPIFLIVFEPYHVPAFRTASRLFDRPRRKSEIKGKRYFWPLFHHIVIDRFRNGLHRKVRLDVR